MIYYIPMITRMIQTTDELNKVIQGGYTAELISSEEKRKKHEIDVLAEPYGSDDLHDRYWWSMNELTRVEGKLNDARLELAHVDPTALSELDSVEKMLAQYGRVRQALERLASVRSTTYRLDDIETAFYRLAHVYKTLAELSRVYDIVNRIVSLPIPRFSDRGQIRIWLNELDSVDKILDSMRDVDRKAIVELAELNREVQHRMYDFAELLQRLDEKFEDVKSQRDSDPKLVNRFRQVYPKFEKWRYVANQAIERFERSQAAGIAGADHAADWLQADGNDTNVFIQLDAKSEDKLANIRTVLEQMVPLREGLGKLPDVNDRAVAKMGFIHDRLNSMNYLQPQQVADLTSVDETALRELDYVAKSLEELGNLHQAVRNLTRVKDTLVELSQIDTASLRELAQIDPDELERLTQVRPDVLHRLSTLPSDVNERLAAIKPDHRRELTQLDISRSDTRMRDYLYEKKMIDDAIAKNSRAYGERHAVMQDLMAAKQRVNQLIHMHVEEYQKSYSYPWQLRDRVVQLRKVHGTAKANTDQLGEHHQKISRLRAQLKEIDERLTETKERLENLRIEKAPSARIELVSEGNYPYEPYRDDRKQLSVVGALAGMMMGVGTVLLIGLLDTRFRAPDDAPYILGNAKLLGILPNLPQDMADPNQASMAGNAVHHIRTLLQLNAEHHDQRVLAITSPYAKDGKTSLVLSLGLSFAKTDNKTLIIDCDVVGGGLTAHARAFVKRRIGQVLVRRGKISEEQLQSALRETKEKNRRLGDVLVDRGLISAEDLLSSLEDHKTSLLGLLDVMSGDEPLESCIAETGVPNLNVLPIGSADPNQAAEIHPTRFRALLEEARRKYRIVLIDTGPIPGSVEASFVTAEADATVLVVSRGLKREIIDGAMEHLNHVRANVAGVVFNRAQSEDIDRHSLSETLQNATRRSRQATQQAEEGEFDAFYGPIAKAVSRVGRDAESRRATVAAMMEEPEEEIKPGNHFGR